MDTTLDVVGWIEMRGLKQFLLSTQWRSVVVVQWGCVQAGRGFK